MLRVTGFYDFRFEDSIHIDAAPEAGFAFFEEMEENYSRWHLDHIGFRWVEGRGLKPGTVFAFEETIAGKLQKKTVRILTVKPGRYFDFAPVNPVFRFFLPLLSFGFRPENGGFRFEAQIRLHGIGPLGRRMNKKEFDAVEAHMAEEGRNLKSLLEGTAKTFARAGGHAT